MKIFICLPVLGDGGSKFSISYEEWPWFDYPPYVMGGAILMSGTAVRPLLAAAQTLPFVPFEDVYLTGLCSLRAGVQLWTSERYARAMNRH